MAVPDPTCVAPSRILTVLPAAAVPVNVGVVSSVTSSLFDAPVSLASVRSGVLGGAGGVVSMVIDRDPLSGDVFEAASVARPRIVWPPGVSTETVTSYRPLPLAMSVPTATPSERIVTVAPRSVLPVKRGVVSFVRSSDCEEPVSLDGWRSGVLGVAGGVVSGGGGLGARATVKVRDALRPTLPAASLCSARAVKIPFGSSLAIVAQLPPFRLTGRICSGEPDDAGPRVDPDGHDTGVALRRARLALQVGRRVRGRGSISRECQGDRGRGAIRRRTGRVLDAPGQDQQCAEAEQTGSPPAARSRHQSMGG